MTCSYCRAWNPEEEHRCQRCGRRLRPAAARPAPDTYPLSAATAPVLRPVPEIPAAAPPPSRPTVSYQQPLFREMPKVIPIPTLPTVKPDGPGRPRGPRSERHRAPRGNENQQTLEFVSAPPPAGRTLRTSVQAVIYCDAQVALPAHRAMASALDASMVGIALGLLLLIFSLSGGDIVLNRHTVPVFAAVAAILGLFYHLLWVLCGGDTAGMRWTQLRLLNFDGRTPTREQRALRMIAGCLSLIAAGVGLLWALADEESLTWHDHISKTFPTPHGRVSRD